MHKSVCYCTNLRRSAHAVTEFYDRALQKLGITAAQYHLLANLQRLQSANITHWATEVGLERSTMVRNITPLLRLGLICQVDGHGKTYALTEKGSETMAVAVPAWEAAQQRLNTYLGNEEAAALLRISEKLQNLDRL